VSAGEVEGVAAWREGVPPPREREGMGEAEGGPEEGVGEGPVASALVDGGVEGVREGEALPVPPPPPPPPHSAEEGEGRGVEVGGGEGLLLPRALPVAPPAPPAPPAETEGEGEREGGVGLGVGAMFVAVAPPASMGGLGEGVSEVDRVACSEGEGGAVGVGLPPCRDGEGLGEVVPRKGPGVGVTGTEGVGICGEGVGVWEGVGTPGVAVAAVGWEAEGGEEAVAVPSLGGEGEGESVPGAGEAVGVGDAGALAVPAEVAVGKR
jgi:hypothetical protein